MSSKRLRKRKERLWKENPHCRNCGDLTILPEKYKATEKQPDNLATIQHFHHKYHPDRHKPNPTGEVRTDLWCYKCNNKDAKEITKNRKKELLWEDAGAYPQGHPLAKDIHPDYKKEILCETI